jgi:hypothetical protein
MGIADLMQEDLSEKVNAFKSAFAADEGDDFAGEEPLPEKKEEE